MGLRHWQLCHKRLVGGTAPVVESAVLNFPRMKNPFSILKFICWLGLWAASPVFAVQFNFNQISDPAGIINQAGTTEGGTVVTTVVAEAESSGQRFTHWEINGARSNDFTGRAMNPVVFSIVQNTDAIAYYLPSTNDVDDDGIPDWYEIQHYGNTNQNEISDTDLDGFDLETEFIRDYHPNLVNSNSLGGISIRKGPSILLVLDTNLSIYTETSTPAGLITEVEQVVSNGSTVISANVDLSAEISGQRFIYWDVNGSIQTDFTGKALSQANTLIASNTTATAHFISTTDDVDTNGIPDWYEFQHFGAISNSVFSDVDGDGFDLETEFIRDYNPLLVNSNTLGGVSIRKGPSLTIILSNFFNYTISSEPPGILTTSNGVAESGTFILTPSLQGEESGHYFTGWEVNGTPQTNAFGQRLNQISFPVVTTTLATAIYTPSTNDVDADGIPDWYEMLYYGNTNQDETADSDGDGFDLETEFIRDYNPLLVNSNTLGGISIRKGPSITIDLQFHTRVQDVLVDGLPEAFFSAAPPSNGTFSVSGRADPAIGDWDGDGDLDLFVSGTGGVTRAFENKGSPVVLSLTDRSTNMVDILSMWTNIPNPSPALGDWNGDGAADLAVGGDTGSVYIISSTGQFTTNQNPSVSYQLNIGGTSAIPAFAEINGDSALDLLVLQGNGMISVYTNSTDTNLPYAAPPFTSNLLGAAVANASSIAVADLNRDGLVDILVSTTGGSIQEHRQTGGSTFTLINAVFGGSSEGFASQLSIDVADMDGDGDQDVIGGFEEGGLIYLKNEDPKLAVSPPSQTLIPGDPIQFSVLNGTGTSTWAFVANNSSGFLDSATGSYTSGPNVSVVDVIEATDSAGLFGRSYINIISTNDVSAVGKAIIVAGGKALNDPVWTATDHMTDNAYNVLRFRGFSKENIQYHNFGPDNDVDGNGMLDDIDAPSTLASLDNTFTNWASNSQKLFIYLANHGSDLAGDGFFRLNGGETVNATTDLKLWLDHIQNTYQTDITLVMDFCYSGSFIDQLAYTGTAQRIMFSSTGPNELTYFIAGGLVSFSDIFFNALLQGFDLETAYKLARDAMAAYQAPAIDDNKNGLFEPGIDGAVARTNSIGASFIVGRDFPVIGNVIPSHSITGSVDLIWADGVSSFYPLERVWCAITAPSHSPNTNTGVPVVDVPEADLILNPATRRYEATLDGFTEQGPYLVNFFAQDIWGSVSFPKQSTITQTGYDERLIIISGGPTNDLRWDAIHRMAGVAYNTAISRQFTRDSIHYLSPVPSHDPDEDGTNDIDAASSLAAISGAITSWAAPADKLTLYLIGEASNGEYRLNDTEVLTASTLDGLLDGFQSTDRPIHQILEFPGSGSYIPTMVAPPSRERITITSARAGQDALWNTDGLVSFSGFFLSEIFGGKTIGDAFRDARDGIKHSSGAVFQRAEMDENGDGIIDKKSSQWTVAPIRYLGPAFVTGDDTPLIGTVMPDVNAPGATNVVLWAKDILDVDGISNVWCVVTPPGFDGSYFLPQTNLSFNASSNRYEAIYPLTTPGTYNLTFFAMDGLSNISPPAIATVMSADAYEVDNSSTNATPYTLHEFQLHNFHASDDEDWAKLYLVDGVPYSIQVENLGTNVDLAFEVYYEEPDGSLTLKVPEEDGTGDGIGEVEAGGIDLSLPSFDQGFYYLRTFISPTATNFWGIDSDYELRVQVIAGGGKLIVVAQDRLNPGFAPSGAVATVVGFQSIAFSNSPNVTFTLTNTTEIGITVTVTTAAGYLPIEDNTIPGEVQNPASVFFGNPKEQTMDDNEFKIAIFQFAPYATVEGTVRDKYTGAWLENAALSFTPKSGVLTSSPPFTSFPDNRPYASNWLSTVTGSFPSNTLLPTVTWDMSITKGNYSNLFVANALTGLVLNTVTALGQLDLWPMDTNGNGIADSWENKHLGGAFIPGTDTDADGLDDDVEYLLGTSPTNPLSSLHTAGSDSNTNGFKITWPTSPGRLYQVNTLDDLVTGEWSYVAGPWTAAAGQVSMCWTDTLSTNFVNRMYTIQVETP